MAGRGWSGRVEDTPLRLSLAQTRHGAAAVVGGGALGQAVGWVPALGGGVPPKQGRGRCFEPRLPATELDDVGLDALVAGEVVEEALL